MKWSDKIHQYKKYTNTLIWQLCLLILILPASASADYELTWSTITGGGGRSTGGSYLLVGSVYCAGITTSTGALGTDVQFTLQQINSDQIRIGYITHNGDAPRSIALIVDLGTASVQDSSDIISCDLTFNGFMDYAHSFPTEYTLGIGHPLADLNNPGVPNFGAGISEFAINMACFDETGNQALGPISSSDLITIQLHGSGFTTVTINADTTRSCSCIEQDQTINLPLQLNMTLP